MQQNTVSSLPLTAKDFWCLKLTEHTYFSFSLHAIFYQSDEEIEHTLAEAFLFIHPPLQKMDATSTMFRKLKNHTILGHPICRRTKL